MTLLEGYRVVELGAWVAGPGAGGVLADWGADVIKVETEAGDPMRRLFDVLGGHKQPQSPPFDLDNRGKRSVVLDLRSDDGRAALTKLVATADVLLTNLRPDALERLDLAAEHVLAANPRLVYASVSGYGLEGPDRDRPGYDLGAFGARTGIAHLHGVPYDEPVAIRSGLGDHVTALTAVTGILAALLERERSGKGQLVATSLLRAGIYCIGWDLGIHLRFGKMAPVTGRHGNANPLVNSYRAGDGLWFWLLGLETDRHWPGLLAAVGRADLGEDERFDSARGRRKNAEALIEILDAEFATATREEWFERFDRENVWWAPVQTPEEVVADPQALAAGAFVDVPEGAGAPAHRAVATPVAFSREGAIRTGAVPGLGEHTEEILKELGLEPS
jgi:crotonobetainyl-CoA:carnitine CoA-transferase CaiB-like acyl-CoA transferase